MAEHRSKRDTVLPCQVCGWAEHMAIHSLVKEGPRAGQHFDHAYVPPAPKPLLCEDPDAGIGHE